MSPEGPFTLIHWGRISSSVHTHSDRIAAVLSRPYREIISGQNLWFSIWRTIMTGFTCMMVIQHTWIRYWEVLPEQSNHSQCSQVALWWRSSWKGIFGLALSSKPLTITVQQKVSSVYRRIEGLCQRSKLWQNNNQHRKLHEKQAQSFCCFSRDFQYILLL